MPDNYGNGYTLEFRARPSDPWSHLADGLTPRTVAQIRLRYQGYGYTEDTHYRFVLATEPNNGEGR